MIQDSNENLSDSQHSKQDSQNFQANSKSDTKATQESTNNAPTKLDFFLVSILIVLLLFSILSLTQIKRNTIALHAFLFGLTGTAFTQLLFHRHLPKKNEDHTEIKIGPASANLIGSTATCLAFSGAIYVGLEYTYKNIDFGTNPAEDTISIFDVNAKPTELRINPKGDRNPKNAIMTIPVKEENIDKVLENCWEGEGFCGKSHSQIPTKFKAVKNSQIKPGFALHCKQKLHGISVIIFNHNLGNSNEFRASKNIRTFRQDCPPTDINTIWLSPADYNELGLFKNENNVEVQVSTLKAPGNQRSVLIQKKEHENP